MSLKQDLEALRQGLGPRPRFAARAAAQEFLDAGAVDAPEARLLQEGLDAADRRFFGRLRQRIRSGHATATGLKHAFQRIVDAEADVSGYGALDRLLAGLLHEQPPGPPQAALQDGMVRYQPTPARWILALIERAAIGPQDRFVDLGSGLGQVLLMTAMLSGARSTGIELEPSYTEHARLSAQGLGLKGADFVTADAREADLTDGTVYFLYTPFRGGLLQAVLERLRAQSRLRPIRVCGHGPCCEALFQTPWLRPRDGSEPGGHPIAVFDAGPGRA